MDKNLPKKNLYVSFTFYSMGEAVRIFYNGTIYVKYAPLTTVEAIATRGETIQFTGTSDETMRLYGKSADTVVNLEGRVVVPGFVDSHIHLDDLGSSLNHLDLRGIDSIEEMKHRIQDYGLKNPDLRVIIGTGWDQELFREGRWPNKWDIDQVENSVPVYLERYCEHAGVVNSKMLKLLSSGDFPEPIFPRTSSGDPNGVVKEEASTYFKGRALEIDGSLERSLITATHYLLSLGVTSIGFVSCGADSIDFLSREAADLGLRVRAYLREDAAVMIDRLREKVGNNHYLQINGIKLFADGALGAGTAALREPYSDDPDYGGILYLDERKLLEIFNKFGDKGVQFAVHAIGDRGIDAVIGSIALADRKKMIEPRIEHCTVLRDDQIAKLRDLNIGVSVQPAFVIDDWWVVRRLGRERSRLAYPLASLLKNEIKLGISTDSPVASPDPWLSVDAAVNRGESEKREILQYSRSEMVDLATALSLYTAGSASLIMSEEVGSLDVGKLADFVVLNKDPFDTRDLKSVRTIETVVGGKTRFKASN